MLKALLRNGRLDRMAMSLSGLCLAHCVGTAIIVALLSSAGSILLSPAIHETGLALAIVIVVARSGGTDEEQPLPVASAATTTSAGPTNIESEFAAPAPDPGSTGATATPTPVQPDKTPPSSGIKASGPYTPP